MKSPQSRTAAAMLDARDSPLSKRRSHRQGRGRGRRTRGTKMRHDLLPLPSHSAIPPRLRRAVLHNVLVIGRTLALAVVVLLAGLADGALPDPAQAPRDATGAATGAAPGGAHDPPPTAQLLPRTRSERRE